MDMNIRDLTGVSSDTVCKHFHISNNSWEGVKRLYQNYDMKDCKVWYCQAQILEFLTKIYLHTQNNMVKIKYLLK